MIEPQNTTMPLPAAPAAAEAKQGDGIGFGEMLAQSLGMAVSVDPSVVPQIASGGQRHQQAGEDAADLADDQSSQAPATEVGHRPPAVNRFVSLTTDGVAAEPTVPVAVAAPVVDDGLVAEPTQQLPTALEDGQDPVAPVTVTTVATPQPNAPADDLGPPLPIATPVAAAGDPVVPTVATPAQADATGLLAPAADPDLPVPPSIDPGVDPAIDPSIATDRGAARQVVSPQPVSADAPTFAPKEPAATPSLPQRSTPNIVTENADTPRQGRTEPGLVRPEMVGSAGVKPAPLRPSQERAVPANPTPTSDSVTTVAMPPVTHVTWPTTTPPRVDLDPQIPIRVDSQRPVATSVGGNSDPVVLEPTPAPAPAPISVSAVDMAPTNTTVTTGTVAAASPSQYSALAERVMQAVEMQANQPPPRTMVVDIPEIEGLRLVVSVRGGAQVHVVPTTGSSTPDAFQPFMNELSGVLSDRGFVMTGDGRERGDDPNDQEQQEVPFRLQRPVFRRPTPTDNDLRI